VKEIEDDQDALALRGKVVDSAWFDGDNTFCILFSDATEIEIGIPSTITVQIKDHKEDQS
jgi:hypothetical protein